MTNFLFPMWLKDWVMKISLLVSLMVHASLFLATIGKRQLSLDMREIVYIRIIADHPSTSTEKIKQLPVSTYPLHSKMARVKHLKEKSPLQKEVSKKAEKRKSKDNLVTPTQPGSRPGLVSEPKPAPKPTGTVLSGVSYKPQPPVLFLSKEPTKPLGSDGISPEKQRDILLQFQSWVRQKIDQAKLYPRQARQMDIEGRVSIRFNILNNGQVGGITVITSSGSSILDKAAKRMVNKAAPFVPIPEQLKNQSTIQIEVPIIFSLAEEQ